MKNCNKPPPVPFFTVSPQTVEARAKREENSESISEEAVKNGFIIPYKLPSLNEYIDACRANRYKGAKLKENTETAIIYAIQQAQKSGRLRRLALPIRIMFIWHEKTKRRDADNVASAKKYILDAMQRVSIIPNDSRKYVIGFTDEIVDDSHDFVEVCIIEASKA